MKQKSVKEVVADLTCIMVTGTFRYPSHLRDCICLYCKNAAATLLYDYERDIAEARRARDNHKVTP
jgi:hypothetical protein